MFPQKPVPRRPSTGTPSTRSGTRLAPATRGRSPIPRSTPSTSPPGPASRRRRPSPTSAEGCRRADLRSWRRGLPGRPVRGQPGLELRRQRALAFVADRWNNRVLRMNVATKAVTPSGRRARDEQFLAGRSAGSCHPSALAPRRRRDPLHSWRQLRARDHDGPRRREPVGGRAATG